MSRDELAMSTTGAPMRWWVRGDLDGFFGLFSNSMANTLTAIFLLSVVAKLPQEIVFGSIVPAVVLSLAFGNIYFAFQGYRLAKREGRNDVTAVPYGISVPHYFIVTFAIFIPVLATTKDPMRAWSIGVAWCFVHAIVVASWATGVAMLLLGCLGLLGLLLKIIPIVAILPILLAVAGTSAKQIGHDALQSGGVAYSGMSLLGNSAILVGALFAAITANIIDKNYKNAGYWAPIPAR